MSVFTISDLHLSFGAEKSMEVFKGWENYVYKLESNWNKIVKPEDTVVIIGDISWSMKLEETFEDLNFIDKLPGKKILIKGNHDFWWSTTSKVNAFLEQKKLSSISILYNSCLKVENYGICGTRGWMYKIMSDQDRKVLSREVGRLRRSIDMALSDNLEPIVFLHYPPIYGRDESVDIINLLIEKKVKKCYYGHIHGNGSVRKVAEGDYKGISLKLVSCDYIDFSPVEVI